MVGNKLIINNGLKYIYIAIPRTASSSIHDALGFSDGHPEPDEHHADIKSILIKYPYAINYFKFAFVRNPWDRFWSLYNEFTVNRIYQYSGKITFEKPLFSEFSNFDDFCLNVFDTEWSNNVFLKPQYLFIEGYNFEIGRFENLQSDLKLILEKIGINSYNLGHYRKSTEKGLYKSNYSKKAIQKVADFYSKDIEIFNYKFE